MPGDWHDWRSKTASKPETIFFKAIDANSGGDIITAIRFREADDETAQDELSGRDYAFGDRRAMEGDIALSLVSGREAVFPVAARFERHHTEDADAAVARDGARRAGRSEEHTSEL